MLYQSMLEPPSGSNEGTQVFTRELDRTQSPFHAAVRATRSGPYTIAFSEPTFFGTVVERVGIQPHRFSLDSQMCGGMCDRLFRGDVVFVVSIVIRDDSNACRGF